MRSNTVPVKPHQLHDPPEGGRGRTERERESVRVSVMRTDCRSGIQSTAELNSFWETGIVQVMCFNKKRFAGPLVWMQVYIQREGASARVSSARPPHNKLTVN